MDKNRRKMAKLRKRYKQALEEIQDLEQEHQRNKEELLETI